MFMPTALPLYRRGAFAFAAMGILALVGCGPSDEIKSYDVKRDPNEAPVAGGAERVRLLGAIIPVAGGDSLFVKFRGSIEEIAPNEKAFDEFVSSIRIGADGKSPTFTAPAGWKELPGKEMRVTTFTPPNAVKDLPELYVSTPFGGTLLMNVNRWRLDDAGLPAVAEADLPKVTTEVMLDKTKAYKVDFKGPGGRKKKGPFAGGM